MASPLHDSVTTTNDSILLRSKDDLLTPGKTKERQWTLRYKWGNHPAQTGIILAFSKEKAEQVGRAWCLKKAAGQMQVVRFICVEDPILADESILDA